LITIKKESMEYIHEIESPLGMLTVSSDGEHISGLWMEKQKYFARTLEGKTVKKDLELFQDVRRWLDIYFSGLEPDFTPPLMPRGTPFQQSIWRYLCKIPHGQTTTYGALAKEFEQENNGKRTSARAVGGAVGRNPISIIIPCHRVIGKDGSLTGYASGIDRKIKLLQLEKIIM
jgi:methylated-DNA-[protein]-cysteine S-methyltransferase